MGYFIPDVIESFLTSLINQLQGMTVNIDTFSIFLHNLRSMFLTYVGGILGVIPAVMLGGNGFIYGSFVGYFIHGGVLNNYGVSNPLHFIIYTLPHGIFEIPALIIASAAGFRLTSIIIDLINSFRGKPYVNNDYQKFKDSMALLAIAVVLFAIAAVIEANFTISIGNYITGLHLHT